MMGGANEGRSQNELDPGWGNLPPHLSQSLRDAMQGLSEAFLDLSHPMSPQLQAMWDVADQIEEWLLATERGSEESFSGRE